MKFIETEIKDCYIIEPVVHGDKRGYFFEAYKENAFKEAGIDLDFIQDNQASSSKGVLRGLHLQKEPYAQTKLIRALVGTILDVAVDLRKGSETFGKYVAVELSEDNKRQLLVPKGFGHGYIVLSDHAEVIYKVDNIYHQESERGFRFDDPDVGVDWGVDLKDVILSEKDKDAPFLKELLAEL